MEDELTKQIIEYLNEDDVDYAILINGEWGSGKTYYINKLIEQYNKKEKENKKDNESNENNKDKYRFIYISLFGLKTTEQIDEKIRNLILIFNILDSNKTKNNNRTKKVIKGVKTSVKFAEKLTEEYAKDLKGKNKYLKYISIQTIPNFIEAFQNRKKYIFVFDDLERASIDYKEILGYINEIVEHDKAKVIIIANEKEILENEKNKDNNKNEYQKYKEKTIRYTFNFSPKIEIAFDNIIEKIQNTEKEEILKYKKSILDVFNSQTNKNIRTLKFSIKLMEKYLKLIENIKKEIINKYKENDNKQVDEFIKEYISGLINFIVSDSINYKINSQNNEDKIIKNNDNKEQIEKIERLNEISKITYEEINKDYLFVRESIENYYYDDSDKLFKSILCYIDDKLNDNSPLVILSDYYEMEDDEIIKMGNQVVKQLEKNEIAIKQYPEVISKIFRLENMGFKFKSSNNIVNIMIKNIEKNSKDNNIEYIDDYDIFRVRFSDKEKELTKKYNECLKKIYDKLDSIKNRQDIEEINKVFDKDIGWGNNLLDYYQSNENKFLNNNSFLKNIEIDKLINKIESGNNKDLFSLLRTLNSVYNFGNIKDYYSDDLPNMEKLKNEIAKLQNGTNGINKKVILNYLSQTLEEKISLLKK